VNFLLDAQLSPRFCEVIGAKGDSCIHLMDIPSGLTQTDEMVWDYARKNGCVIITKDRDFFERSALLGSPPQVLFIRVGNCSNDHLITLLLTWWVDISIALSAGSRLVVLRNEGIQKF